MKRIFFLTAAMLLWGGTVVAGELKVMVPVDELKQMKSRLESLEKENNLLKQAEKSGASSSVGADTQGRLQAAENENSRLRQELNALKGQEHSSQASADVQARLDAVEKENRQLRESLQARGNEKSSGGEDAGMAAKLDASARENSKLQQELKLLKEGGVAVSYAENKISAREQYFLARRKSVSHIYKF